MATLSQYFYLAVVDYDMEPSPLKTHLLKRQVRRTILSSDEEEMTEERPAEVYEDLQIPDTHCACSDDSIFTGGSTPPPEANKDTSIEQREERHEHSPQVDASHGREIVIPMGAAMVDSPWDSEVDGQESDTSTPGYKRGKQEEIPTGPSNSKVVQAILDEGMGFRAPDWMRNRRRHKSILVLSDAQFKYWPAHDKVCQVEYHPKWPLARWAQAIRLGQISIDCDTVVIYLEGTRQWKDLPPIKNMLQSLCKVVRALGNNPRIFVAISFLQ